MTEPQWLAATDPAAMLKFLGARAGPRKARLFACACCRRHWHWVEGTPAAKAVAVAEKFADGRATAKQLARAYQQSQTTAGEFYTVYRQTQGVDPYIAHMHASACAEAAQSPPERNPSSVQFALSAAGYAAQTYASEVTNTAGNVNDLWWRHHAAESAVQAVLVRDIFGNPFSPVELHPAWLSSDVTLITEGIYAESAWERLPILADALQDAGCDADNLLAHLRDESLLPHESDANAGPPPASHARGCWALDLVLGFT
jgi:hypothetical protein